MWSGPHGVAWYSITSLCGSYRYVRLLYKPPEASHTVVAQLDALKIWSAWRVINHQSLRLLIIQVDG